ncbi:hypothetical protein HDU77_011109 [Chytriomyces hyalinus]|nr:hypothetical protein HDU77_011109 [Chytriomyces hyalinus]
MDAFESSSHAVIDATTTCHGSIARSAAAAAAFENMPPEILNRIVQFVDGESILPLCHALPYFKYISAAMLDFAHRFPNEYRRPSQLWPYMIIRKNQSNATNVTDFPIQHIHATRVYARIISMHGGHIFLPCIENVLNYLGAFPDTISVYADNDSSSEGCVEFLRQLADANKKIRFFVMGMTPLDEPEWDEVAHQLTRLSIKSIIWECGNCPPDEIWDALPFISGLSYLEMGLPHDTPEITDLAGCLDLTEISFTEVVRNLKDGTVENIMELIKGSRIQKVWCDVPLRRVWKETYSEDFEILSREFLKYGWDKEMHDDDERVCFCLPAHSFE